MLVTACKVDSADPWSVKDCDVKYGSWTYDGSKLDLNLYTKSTTPPIERNRVTEEDGRPIHNGFREEEALGIDMEYFSVASPMKVTLKKHSLKIFL